MSRAVFAILVVLGGCRPSATQEDPPVTAAGGDAASVGDGATAPAEVRKRVLEARLLGQTLGTLEVDRAALPDGGERWTMATKMTLKLEDRGESPKTIETEEVTDYDANGELVRSHEITREVGVEEKNELVREGDELRVVIEGPSHREEKRFPLPKTFRSELAVYRELLAQAKGGAALPLSKTYATFDEDRMKFRDSTLTIEKRASVTVGGEELAGWAIVATDDDGERTKAVFDEHGMALSLEIGVFSAVLAGSSPSTEMAKLSSMLEVKGNFAAAAKTLELEVAVEHDEADLPPVFAENEYQHVTRKDGTYTLELKSMACDAGCNGHSLPLTVPKDVAPFFAATATSQSGDEAIVQRARAIAGSRKDAREVAEAIVQWSYETLEKRDGVRGAGTAVETLAQNGGDCTEHTSLTVALLRAAGIPARNTSGIVMIPGIFGADAGYHAWVEVWLGEWVVMDPALGKLAPGPHYIRLGHEEPGMEDGTSAMARLLGRTTIRVKS